MGSRGVGQFFDEDGGFAPGKGEPKAVTRVQGLGIFDGVPGGIQS